LLNTKVTKDTEGRLGVPFVSGHRGWKAPFVSFVSLVLKPVRGDSTTGVILKCSHSSRRARMGSIAAARAAGMSAAVPATTTSTSGTTAKVSGS
jgi:hypothetical protein